ncbi:histidine kinase [Streptomyces fumigatiscleroticus]|nr:histidine kinase [Streptomyces fumigatiscleroticus]
MPWPRREGGVDLSVQAVNDWFPKQRGSKESSVPQDFQDLWSVVAVMLEWTGRLTETRFAGRLRRDWYRLHQDAQRRTGLDEEVHAYLEAARKAAEQHPYPGVADRSGPPSLAEVYVRQRSSPAARNGNDAARGDGAAAAAEPAEVIFRAADRVCVLIAGPGGGKSTLLRTWLRDAADQWLGAVEHVGTAAVGVPVRVSARALSGEETQVPDALAAATRKLSRYGRHPELDKARFVQRPCTGASWLLLVDGLDELPNAQERRAVLEKIANAAAEDPPLYRCVVATRPLNENELDVLDRTLGRRAPRFDLKPFTAEDLHTYTGKYFGTRWPREEALGRARQFTRALRRVGLTELARTPLMAFMLCRLYLADPERSLPEGRTGLYEAFVDLVYESNHSKHIADSHEEAIKHLVESLQSLRTRSEANNAARQACEQLPELIGFLAHQWLTGHRAPAATTLASHEAVSRPDRLRPERWDAFLEDLLRQTGLLTHRTDGLGFPHRTFLEYHAARHATRDQQARRQVLHRLFDSGAWQHQEPSYLGFLLDRLLTPRDRISAETTAHLENLSTRGGEPACDFLVRQVWLTTVLPAAPTARQLTRHAGASALGARARYRAARAVTRVDGFQDAGALLLETLAQDPTFDGHYRVEAAWELAEQGDEYRDEGVRVLAALAQDSALGGYRVEAARAVVGMGGYRDHGVRLLEALANDTGLKAIDRVNAAELLAVEVDGCRERGVRLLEMLAQDPVFKALNRLQAVFVLVEKVDGYRDEGIRLLEVLSQDPTLNEYDRLRAARALPELRRRAGQAARRPSAGRLPNEQP